MPSTRGGGRHDLAEGLADSDADDEFDPDYDEGSSDDDLPHTMERDRAQWVVDNTDGVEELYRVFKDAGQQVFGRVFFQVGDITRFAHFLYRYTTPGAE